MQLTFDHIWYQPGDRVKLLTTVSEAPSGDSPGGALGLVGEQLVVRVVSSAEVITEYE